MTIHVIRKPKSPRLMIGFFEEDPPADARDHLNRFELCRLEDADCRDPKRLAAIAAVVLRQHRKPQVARMRNFLDRHANTLLAHGSLVFIDVQSGTSVTHFKRLVKNLLTDLSRSLPVSGFELSSLETESIDISTQQPALPAVHIFGARSDWGQMYRMLTDFPVGPAPNISLDCRCGTKLSNEQIALLQRAFHDARRLVLVEQKNGLSGVLTFRAYAVLRDSILGGHESYPYQYFVKLGNRDIIFNEYKAYRSIALDHIPFHLGPGLRLERCALGGQQGILVSDFVNGTERLIDCARENRAVPAIAGLFNVTLCAWHAGATKEAESMHEHAKKILPNDARLPSQRRQLAKELGATISPVQLKSRLDSLRMKPAMVGAIHGDLHAKNILVRNEDAVIIDIEKMASKAPVLFDHASLEAGMLVDGFAQDARSAKALLCSVKPLYQRAFLIEYERWRCDPSEQSAWFFDCVRQIRMHARMHELQPGQYAFALATMLLRKGCKKLPRDQSKASSAAQRTGVSAEGARAIAYVLAECIANDL